MSNIWSSICGCQYFVEKGFYASLCCQNYDISRIIGNEFSHDTFHALFLCAHFPYGSTDKYDEYLHCFSLIKQIIDEYPLPYVYILGDFNYIFLELMMSLCNRRYCCIIDKMLLPSDIFKNLSMAYGSPSWLDHCISTLCLVNSWFKV